MKKNIDIVLDFFSEYTWITEDPNGDLCLWKHTEKPWAFEFGGSGNWAGKLGRESWIITAGCIDIDWGTSDWCKKIAGQLHISGKDFELKKFDYDRSDFTNTVIYKTICKDEEKVCIGSDWCEKECNRFLGFKSGMVKCGNK